MMGKNEANYVNALCSLVLMFLGLFDINDLILHCIRSSHYWLIFGLEPRERKSKKKVTWIETLNCDEVQGHLHMFLP